MPREVLGRGRAKRRLAFARPIVDKGHRVVFGSTYSYIKHVARGQNFPMCRKNEPSRSVRFGGPADENEHGEPGLRWHA